MGPVVIGVDIGRQHDPTAVCVVEVIERQRPRTHFEADKVDLVFVTRFLDRLPLRTPYPQVAQTLTRLAAGVRARSGSRTPPIMRVDVTGVGRPVFDSLADTDIPHVCRLTAVTITGSMGKEIKDRELSVGKLYLVSRLEALFDNDRIKFVVTTDKQREQAHAMRRELQDFDRDQHASTGNLTFGAKTGSHDDLVTALALAVLEDTGVRSSIRHFESDPEKELDSLMAGPVMQTNLLDIGF